MYAAQRLKYNLFHFWNISNNENTIIRFLNIWTQYPKDSKVVQNIRYNILTF